MSGRRKWRWRRCIPLTLAVNVDNISVAFGVRMLGAVSFDLTRSSPRVSCRWTWFDLSVCIFLRHFEFPFFADW
ncbi:hypothetical protein EJ06DRAFT_393504 [Trichodelitschia bisporula]|uniref:Uncharacterized protein n=1 Tax=Trichodelitschia bisporula TaxID=703511 RepID=A0A6G1I064_9PEZI|nr:hypothetical protein EJ06DRAFT_393504 [Trichodelitschia bisporula]